MSTIIAFIVNTAITFSHDIWEKAPCPGSELAVIHTARALAKFKHLSVHIVCPTNAPGLYEGVCFHHIHDNFFKNELVDIFIHVRSYWPVGPFPGKTSAIHILWLQDTYHEIQSLSPSNKASYLSESLNRYDALVFASEWHLNNVVTHTGLSKDELIAVAFYQPLPYHDAVKPHYKNRLIHTSHPRKSLIQVLAAFEYMVLERPDLKLVLCGHPDIYQESTLKINGQTLTLTKLLNQLPPVTSKNVELLPNLLSQKDVLREDANSAVLLHPDISIETGATTVLEAMSVGTVPIVSNQGCLPEICWRRGLIVPYSLNGFEKNFAKAVISILSEPSKLEKLRMACQEFTQPLSESSYIAERWMFLIENIKCKKQSPEKIILNEQKNTNPRITTTKGSKYFTVIDASSLSRKKWEKFINQANGAWFTHSITWYQNLESSYEDKNVKWFAVQDSCKNLIAIVPLVKYPSDPNVAISGLWDPSGPCIASNLTYKEFELTVKTITKEFVSMIEKKAIAQLILKFSVLGSKGLSDNTPEIVPLLRDSGFIVDKRNMFIISGSKEKFLSNISQRLKEKIRSVSGAYNIRMVQSIAQLKTLWKLYRSHSLNKGVVFANWKSFYNLWKSDELITCAYTADNCQVTVGFAVAIIYGCNAAIWTWGVEQNALNRGLSKLLLYSVICDLFRHGVMRIEYGTSLFGEHQFEGISEFYRRFGGDSKPFFLARLIGQRSKIVGNYHVT